MAFEEDYKSIVLSSSHKNHSAVKEPLLIFFITGNPGLVSYYETYLAILHDLCSKGLVREDGKPVDTHIYACSLAGFEPGAEKNRPFAARHGDGPYNLDQEIEYIDNAIDDACRDIERRGADASAGVGSKVVLVGHSVGTYIAMEIISRRQARAEAGTSQIANRIIGGILLTPTVVDLHLSPNGKRANWTISRHYFAPLVSTLARALWLVPEKTLAAIVKMVNGFEDDSSLTTARFLRSHTAVHQALFLARTELAQMRVNKWNDEVWGVASAASPGPEKVKTKLFFLFAEKDHWIADETRDTLMAVRANSGKVGQKDMPEMEVDRTGMVHAFCIRHNRLVAEKTFGYLQSIVRGNWQ